MPSLPPPPPNSKNVEQVELVAPNGADNVAYHTMDNLLIKKGKSSKPNLESAIKFGKETRSMRVWENNEWRLALPGESEEDGAEEFPLCAGMDALDMLDEFGVGISLYFRQLVFYVFVFICCFILYLPAMFHMYSPKGQDGKEFYFKGSALNTDATYNATMMICSLAVFALLCIVTFLLKYGKEKLEDLIDDGQLTTQDFAIVLNSAQTVFLAEGALCWRQTRF